jgi:hypothetical protein
MKPDKQWFELLKDSLKYNPKSGVFTWGVSDKRRAGNQAGTSSVGGYIQIKFQGKFYFAHRLAWLLVHGTWPTHEINHKNGNKKDNRITNLEDIEHHLNLSLRHKVRGVRERNGKFYARVCKNRKEFREGPFESVDKAREAYFQLREEVLRAER